MNEQEAQPKGKSIITVEWVADRILLPVIGFLLVTSLGWVVWELNQNRDGIHRVELAVMRIETHLGLSGLVSARRPESSELFGVGHETYHSH